MSDERVTAVINNLSSLIIQHAHMVAQEQYAPSRTADASDEVIAEHKKWVDELRNIRQRFENLVTGIIP